MLARRAANTLIQATHHAAGRTRRVVMEPGPVIVHRLLGSWGGAVGRFGCASVAIAIVLRSNHYY